MFVKRLAFFDTQYATITHMIEIFNTESAQFTEYQFSNPTLRYLRLSLRPSMTEIAPFSTYHIKIMLEMSSPHEYFQFDIKLFRDVFNITSGARA